MKKMMTICAVLALAGYVSAQVESVNIVGYNSVPIDQQWTILGVNFEGVGGGSLSLQDAFPFVEGMTMDNNSKNADNIQIQNASGTYDIYYLSNGKNAKGADVAGLAGKWAAFGSYSVANIELAPGTAMWYLARNPIGYNITTAGQVSQVESALIPVDQMWRHITNPFACDLPLNDGIPFTEGMTKDNNSKNADNIQIQNAVGTYEIYYMSNGKNAKGAVVEGLEGKWAAFGSYTPTENVLPLGKGAWYLRRGTADFDIEVVRPYDL